MPNTLKIVVLGDSVPWGQGLLDEHKYANNLEGFVCRTILLVKTYRRAFLNNDVEPTSQS
jgi:hypothetical protein